MPQIINNHTISVSEMIIDVFEFYDKKIKALEAESTMREVESTMREVERRGI